ncbi:MAG: coiled-coil domain-containing protein [Candidatus Asgardarchaeia archaeon]
MNESDKELVKRFLYEEKFDDIEKILEENPSLLINALKDDEVAAVIKEKIVESVKNKNLKVLERIIRYLTFCSEHDFNILLTYMDIISVFNRIRSKYKEIEVPITVFFENIQKLLEKRISILARRMENARDILPLDLLDDLEDLKNGNISRKLIPSIENFYRVLNTYNTWLDILGDIEEYILYVERFRSKIPNIEKDLQELDQLKSKASKSTFQEFQKEYISLKSKIQKKIDEYLKLTERYSKLKENVDALNQLIYMQDAKDILAKVEKLLEEKNYDKVRGSLDSLSFLMTTRYKFYEAIERKMSDLKNALIKIKEYKIDCDYLFDRLEKVKQVLKTENYPRVPNLLKLIEKEINKLQKPHFEGIITKVKDSEYTIYLKNYSGITMANVKVKLQPELAIIPNDWFFERINEYEEIKMKVAIRGLEKGHTVLVKMDFLNMLTDKEDTLEIELQVDEA